MPTIKTNSETKFSIGGVSTGTGIADYTAATFVEVTDVEDLGEFGDEATIVPFNSVGDGRTKKAVGTRDAGDMTIVVGRVEGDAGQAAMRAAAKTNDVYAFKVEMLDGTEFYFSGPVSSAKNQFGGSDDIVKTAFTLAITSAVLEVEAA